MLKKLLSAAVCGLTLTVAAWAQDEPTRPRTNNPIPPADQPADEPQQTPETQPTPQPRPRRTASATRNRAAATTPSPTKTDIDAVRATFADLVKAIESVDVEGVTKIYWNSPALIMFNRNGTVTKTWEQMRENREASYATVKDVKLTTREVNVEMLGRDGAVLSCLWTQSQKNDGRFESASGRMTLVFRRINDQWRIIHLHTSPLADK